MPGRLETGTFISKGEQPKNVQTVCNRPNCMELFFF